MSNLTCRRTKNRETKLAELDVSFTELVDWALKHYESDYQELLFIGKAVKERFNTPDNRALCEVVSEGLMMRYEIND